MTVKSVKPCFIVCACVLFYLFFDTKFSKILLVNSGDIETNPGPRKSSPIKVCHFFHYIHRKVVINYTKIILKDRGKPYDCCYILYIAICARNILKTHKKFNNL